MKDKMQIISEDEFLECLHKLEENGVNGKVNKYYFVKDDSESLERDKNIENDENYNSSGSYTNDDVEI